MVIERPKINYDYWFWNVWVVKEDIEFLQCPIWNCYTRLDSRELCEMDEMFFLLLSPSPPLLSEFLEQTSVS